FSVDDLNQILPSHWSHNNPIDVLGDALPDRYAKTVEVASQDREVDGLLAILCPQGMSQPTLTAEKLVPLAKGTGKPIIASWIGGAEMLQGVQALNRAGIPTFPYPDTAARVFQYMWRYSENLRALYETPALHHDADSSPDRTRAAHILNRGQQNGRTLLTESESKQLLEAYGIPVVQTSDATTADEAVQLAETIGFPV